MINSNKGKLYSTFIIAALILALGATVLLGENKQAKLKEENLKIAVALKQMKKIVQPPQKISQIRMKMRRKD